MLLPLFFLLFVGMPILEIYVIIQVGEAIGILPTLALLIFDSLLGAWLMRSQGRIVWRRFTAALEAGRPPAREVLDGALVIVGGALGLAPGFVTDAFGLLLIAPPTRAIVRRALVRRLARRGAMRVGAWAGGRGGRAPGPADYDVEGTAHEDPFESRRLP
ncbi:MAG: FxsA family protein [Solirubrobacteraceae bacterium]